MLSIDTIRSAQDSDFKAISTLVDEMSSRVTSLANKAAYRMGHDFEGYADAFRQDANVALWSFLRRFEGATVDSFYAGAYRAMEGALKDAVREERNGPAGADKDAVKAFGQALVKADGDVYLAERLAQIHAYCGSKLSADRANAARLAWQGSVSIDTPVRADANGAGVVLAEKLPFTDSTDVDHTAAEVSVNTLRRSVATLEDFLTVPASQRKRGDLFDALQLVHEGKVTVDVLDILSESVTVPPTRDERLKVLFAFGAIAAAVPGHVHSASPADEFNYSGDEDTRYAAQVQKRNTVHAILDAMSERQRLVLSHTYGIRGHQNFGSGDSGDLEGMAAHTGVDAIQLNRARVKGRKTFAAKWVKAMARSGKHAEELSRAAAGMLKPGGRK